MNVNHLYIHVPFCARRCSYCDFSIAVRRVTPVDDYLGALRIELAGAAPAVPPAATGSECESAPASECPSEALDTLYFGGGTPSLLGADGVSRLVALVREFHALAPGAEVTLEANPDDVSPTAAAKWAAAGINRLSLGVQTFDDSALGWMHRTHSAAQSVQAVRSARSAGFDNISLDLIFALPSELGRSWKRDLDTAMTLEPDHISLYGLTVEAATPLFRWEAAGRVESATDDRYATEFLTAHETASTAGYGHYEVSNFARAGRQSRHNSAYWSGRRYRGAGPSAHSFDGSARSWNVSPYTEWAARLAKGDSVTAGEEKLTPNNRAAERVYLGLRTTAGYAASPDDLDIARPWAAAGWAVIEKNRIRLTPEGWLRLDTLAAGLTGF